MSDTVQIVLIVAAVIIIILIIFRRQLSKFIFKATKEGIETSLETRKPASESGQDSNKTLESNSSDVNIKKNLLFGKKNKIEVGRDDVSVSDNKLLGEEQQIIAKSDSSSPDKKP